MGAGRPLKYKNVEELQKALDDYKGYLQETDRPPTIAGLAYYTGIDRQTIYNYQKRDEFFDTLKKFRDWIIMNYEEHAIAGKNAGGVIFLLKNYGYTDKQEITHEGKFEIRTDLIEKYLKDEK